MSNQSESAFAGLRVFQEMRSRPGSGSANEIEMLPIPPMAKWACPNARALLRASVLETRTSDSEDDSVLKSKEAGRLFIDEAGIWKEDIVVGSLSAPTAGKEWWTCSSLVAFATLPTFILSSGDIRPSSVCGFVNDDAKDPLFTVDCRLGTFIDSTLAAMKNRYRKLMYGYSSLKIESLALVVIPNGNNGWSTDKQSGRATVQLWNLDFDSKSATLVDTFPQQETLLVLKLGKQLREPSSNFWDRDRVPSGPN